MNAKQWYQRQIMSWLARSLANSLRLDPGDDDPHNDVVPSSSFISAHPSPPPQQTSFSSSANHDHPHHHYGSDTPSEEAQSRGVKEDLSELSQTLTRQFWGVASFLAPPHTPSHSPLFDPPDRSDHFGSAGRKETSGSPGGDRSEFGEIGGRFRSGVSEVSRMASDLITVDTKEKDDKIEELVEYSVDGEYENGQVVVGITHEVLTFARNIAMHPETWLDFPIDEEEDTDDFDMSVAQREHAFAIEQFSPRLAALRNELCPYHMSLGYFWKVYFVLLHSRLNKYDAEILSTPQVMAARAKWMQELHKQTKPDPDYSARSISHFRDDSNSLEDDYICNSENMPLWSFSTEPTASSHGTTDHEIEKHPVVSTEMHIIDKSVIEEECASKTNNTYSPVGPSKIPIPDFEDEDNDWLEEEDLQLQGYKTSITMGNEEDVSFSDLEDDDDYNLPKKLGTGCQ